MFCIEDDWIADNVFRLRASQCLCIQRDTYFTIYKVRHNVYTICDCDCDSKNVICNLSVVKGSAHLHTSTGTTSNTLHMNNFHGLNLFSSTHSLLFRHSFCRLYVSTLHFSTIFCLLWFFFFFPLSLSLRVSIRLVCLFSI